MKKIIISALLSASFAAAAFAQTINPMTQAMLEGYADILASNPNDYMTLYERAAQYYRLSDYDRAATDILRSIENTPAKDTEQLTMEYQLAADIFMQTGDYNRALEMADKSLQAEPGSIPMLYTKGNICLHLKDYEGAQNCFAAMRRADARSQEAYFGLAQVAVARGEGTEADRLMKEAEQCNPSSWLTYARLGDLCVELKDYDRAATHYLSAFGLADNSDRPVASLLSLARTDYSAVANALDYASIKSENTVPIYFLKGSIAYATGHLNDAYTALRQLTELPDGKDGGVYRKLADACLALGRTDEGVEAAQRAVSLHPDAESYITLSKLLAASGKNDAAVEAADKAVTISKEGRRAVVALAEAKMEAGDADGALTLLNNAVMTDADDLLPLMLRAYLYNHKLAKPREAVADYMRVSRMDARTPAEEMYKALAKTLNGRKLDGDAAISAALGKDGSAEMLYQAAVYYAQTGQLEKAVEMRDKARQAGYENEYLLSGNGLANLTLKPLRHL